MGFKTTRADADLWDKPTKDRNSYEYIAKHVDVVLYVGKNPENYIQQVKEKFTIRNKSINPEYYLGNGLTIQKDGTIKIGLKKNIKEVISKHENKHRTLRKENFPHAAKDHPELDQSEFLDSARTTIIKSIMGVCKWISIAGRVDTTFVVSSLNCFSSKPCEGHLKRTIRILGYQKKYPSREYN